MAPETKEKADDRHMELVEFDAPFQMTNRFRVGEAGVQFPSTDRTDPCMVEDVWVKDGAVCVKLRSMEPSYKGQTAILVRVPGATAVQVGRQPTELPADCAVDPADGQVKHRKFIKAPEPAPAPEGDRALKPVGAAN